MVSLREAHRVSEAARLAAYEPDRRPTEPERAAAARLIAPSLKMLSQGAPDLLAALPALKPRAA
jgi:hypothetical protein